MNTIDIGKLPIKITEVGFQYAIVDVGDIPAQIIEPKPSLLKQGFVYLGTVDYSRDPWNSLIACELNGRKLPGASADPRLVAIGLRIFHGKMTEKDIGKILPPRE